MPLVDPSQVVPREDDHTNISSNGLGNYVWDEKGDLCHRWLVQRIFLLFIFFKELMAKRLSR